MGGEIYYTNLFNHATKRVYQKAISFDDFLIIVDECCKNVLPIAAEKIRTAAKEIIGNIKRNDRREIERQKFLAQMTVKRESC